MIEAMGLTRTFGAFTAVESVTLRVPDGAILALLGPNGAGKTTTVRMLAGLLTPSAGEARVAGFDIRSDAAAVRTRVGLVTDTPGLHEQMTLNAYLDFFGKLYGMSTSQRARRIAELLALFELTDRRRERMAGFSKGMKQKVALARALLHEPAALFLDEPTSGLDPLATRTVRDLIVGLKNASRSIILCTHDLDEAERLADEVAIVRRGHIVASDAPATLRAQATDDTLAIVELAEPCPAAWDALHGIAALTLEDDDASHTDATHLRYSTPQPRQVNPLALERLVTAGARVVSLTCQTRTLEDVYAEAMGVADRKTNSEAPMRMMATPTVYETTEVRA